MTWWNKPPTTFREVFLNIFTHADFAILVCEGCYTISRATPAEAEVHAMACTELHTPPKDGS